MKMEMYFLGLLLNLKPRSLNLYQCTRHSLKIRKDFLKVKTLRKLKKNHLLDNLKQIYTIFVFAVPVCCNRSCHCRIREKCFKVQFKGRCQRLGIQVSEHVLFVLTIVVFNKRP